MAEISSLLGLITDDNTRQALIAQMENMFDNAPDEERLIQEIGNPTKVAVALIRYADSGIMVIHRPENGGKGAACLSGFRAAAKRGFTHDLR